LPKNSNSRELSFLPNVITVLGGQAGCAALALLTEVCYARFLGPSGRGQISLCLMIVGMGVLVGGLGGDVPIVLWAADANKKFAQWVPGVLAWASIGSAFAICIWYVVYWRWHPIFLKGITVPLAWIILISIPITIFFVYLMAIITGREQFRARAGISLIDQLGGLLAFLAFFFLFRRNAEMAMVGNLLGVLVGAALILALIKDHLPPAWRVHPRDQDLVAGLRMGLRGQWGNLAAFFNYRFDVFIVNNFLDTSQVGLYALGVIISEALWQIPQAAALALFPRTARTLDQGASQFTCLIMRQVFLVASVSGLAIALASPIFVPLVFGTRFNTSVEVIWWILPGTVALALAKVACSDLAARGKNGYSSVAAVLALAVTIVLDFRLIPRIGINGAAMASSAAYLVQTIFILAALRHELKVKWRALLIPSFGELGSYYHAGVRFKHWLWPPPASAGGASLD